MKGLDVDPITHRLTIQNDARVVATTDGTLINTLTTDLTFDNVSVIFPDLTKNNEVTWQATQQSSGAPPWNFAELGTSFVTAVPQEYDQTIDLADVPSGADFFTGWAKLSRSNTPSTWQGRALAVIPKQNVWLPFVGGMSVMLEAEFGFCRMLHVYIDDVAGKLRIGKQQSVSVAPGGATQTWSSGTTNGKHSHGGVAGMPIFTIASSAPASYSSFVAGGDHRADRGGSVGPSLADHTNYSSTYLVSVHGRFGRRS